MWAALEEKAKIPDYSEGCGRGSSPGDLCSPPEPCGVWNLRANSGKCKKPRTRGWRQIQTTCKTWRLVSTETRAGSSQTTFLIKTVWPGAPQRSLRPEKCKWENGSFCVQGVSSCTDRMRQCRLKLKTHSLLMREVLRKSKTGDHEINPCDNTW